jgi:hypothetical protein
MNTYYYLPLNTLVRFMMCLLLTHIYAKYVYDSNDKMLLSIRLIVETNWFFPVESAETNHQSFASIRLNYHHYSIQFTA